VNRTPVLCFLNSFICIIPCLATMTQLSFIRISPFESSSAKQLLSGSCDPIEADSNQNEFTIANSFWFLLATMFRQKTEIVPRCALNIYVITRDKFDDFFYTLSRALSTRLLSAFWWFFTMVMIATYTANMVAILSVAKTREMPVTGAAELTQQTRIKFGTYCCGSTHHFFAVNRSAISQLLRIILYSDS
jgi:ionotropic glutamate receptor